jgi:hypothetical protein
MAKNYNDIVYSETKNGKEAAEIFDALDNYLDYCRFELLEFDPAHYSIRGNHHPQYRGYLNSKRPRKPYQGNKPRFNNNRRYEQNFSR